MRLDPTACALRVLLKRPGGITLLEMTVAAGILAVLISTSVQMIRVVSAQQRAAERRAVAMQTVQALAEQLGNLPWDELTPQSTEQITIPAVLAAYLPGAKLAVTLNGETEDIAAKRVAIELTWKAPNGQPAGPVRLTTWSFPDQPPPPE